MEKTINDLEDKENDSKQVLNLIELEIQLLKSNDMGHINDYAKRLIIYFQLVHQKIKNDERLTDCEVLAIHNLLMRRMVVCVNYATRNIFLRRNNNGK